MPKGIRFKWMGKRKKHQKSEWEVLRSDERRTHPRPARFWALALKTVLP